MIRFPKHQVHGNVHKGHIVNHVPRQLLEKQSTKMEVIVTFLVILEMMKMGQIDIVQENIFDDIMITAREQQNGQE